MSVGGVDPVGSWFLQVQTKFTFVFDQRIVHHMLIMPQNFEIGDRILHPSWGLGQVLKAEGTRVTVYFESVGEKALRTDFVALTKVEGDEAKSVLLDSMPKGKRKAKRAFHSLDSLIELFEREYPGGFHGEEFAERERDYKMAGHVFAVGLLDQESLRGLLEAGEHAEIGSRARKVIQKLNLPSPYEVMKLRATIGTNEVIFAEGFVDFLYGADSFSIRFERFADLLSEKGADKWPIVTYYPFILFPAEHMFLKPEVTQAAADACGFELMYRTQVNARTYEKLLDFSHYLFEKLSDLKPRDMIDVQSFIWCVENVSR